MVIVLGEFRLPLDRIEEARAAMERVIHTTRAEAGCITYNWAEDFVEPGRFRISEAWESRAALDAHAAAPHMLAWRDERELYGVTDRQITIYDTSEAA